MAQMTEERKRMGRPLDDNDLEDFKKSTRFLMLALDDAQYVGYDRITASRWAEAHAKYYNALVSDTRNQILLEMAELMKEQVGVLQNISAKLSEVHFKK